MGDNGQALASKMAEAIGAVRKLCSFIGMEQDEATAYAQAAGWAAYHHAQERRQASGDSTA